MDWRTFRDTDLPAIAALLADGLTYDRPSVTHVRYLLLEDPGFDPQLIWVTDDAEWSQQLPDGRLAVPPTIWNDAGAAIGELIERGSTSSSSGENGRRTLSILLGILQSGAAGSTRVDFPVGDLSGHRR